MTNELNTVVLLVQQSWTINFKLNELNRIQFAHMGLRKMCVGCVKITPIVFYTWWCLYIIYIHMHSTYCEHIPGTIFMCMCAWNLGTILSGRQWFNDDMKMKEWQKRWRSGKLELSIPCEVMSNCQWNVLVTFLNWNRLNYLILPS